MGWGDGTAGGGKTGITIGKKIKKKIEKKIKIMIKGVNNTPERAQELGCHRPPHAIPLAVFS